MKLTKTAERNVVNNGLLLHVYDFKSLNKFKP